MANRQGSLSINSENIFPIIKKWLYSDQDIFLRELVSNACDAITKLKKLEIMGEYEFSDDYKPTVKVTVNPEEKKLTISDNGIGMTADEVDEYINQIAFSGATDFLEKYKDKTNEDQIIGHFGLGFYSAFMVADEVHIDTLSCQDGAVPVHWECDGGTEFQMEDGTRTEVGTTVTLLLNEDCTQYCNEYRAREVLEKYCSFMPIEIYLSKENAEPEYETIDVEDKLETDTVIETIHEEAKMEEQEDENGEKKMVEVSPAKDKYKILKRPVPVNDIHPLWGKTPRDCTDEEYKEFYRKVFADYKEPLFWIHLNMDYPFNLKGILYFPKINTEYDSIEGTIKLYNNQVFIADNIKEVIPEFLMLLKGVIDCPDLPLNVSRSALQNDGFVKKIADYITKKVADKLSGMCKTQKETYEKYWDDIAPFIKFGVLKDPKFGERINDYILFKDLNGKYKTLPECLETEKKDKEDGETAEGEAADAKADSAETTDQPKADGEKENSGKTGKENADAGEGADSEPAKKTIFYVTDEQQQSQYIRMFKEEGLDAYYMTHNIDTPFISQLEQQNEGVRFQRIDADLNDSFKSEDGEDLKETADNLTALFRKALGKDSLDVKVEKLKNDKIASMMTVSEESRRMQDMMKMYSMYGMGSDMFPVSETLILNASHPLVQYVREHNDGEHTEMFCKQLYDLAKISLEPLDSDAMSSFISRSNEIMMLLTK